MTPFELLSPRHSACRVLMWGRPPFRHGRQAESDHPSALAAHVIEANQPQVVSTNGTHTVIATL